MLRDSTPFTFDSHPVDLIMELFSFCPCRGPPGQKNYRCTVCEKSFTQKSHVESHMLIHQAGEKLKCDLCDRAFIRKHDLRTHMFYHTKYVPSYTCTVYAHIYSGLIAFRCHGRILAY